jgi:hypothetical protein
MSNAELLKVILTSSLIAGFISALISAVVSIKVKSIDYKNEYFKKILEKRLDSYKFLEAQILLLKISGLEEDGRPFHLVFAYGEEKFYEFQQNLIQAMSFSIWVNEKTVILMEKLNKLFFKISRIDFENSEALVLAGKIYHEQISQIILQLEMSVREDLLDLHDLRKFKKNAYSKRTRLFEMEK